MKKTAKSLKITIKEVRSSTDPFPIVGGFLPQRRAGEKNYTETKRIKKIVGSVEDFFSYVLDYFKLQGCKKLEGL